MSSETVDQIARAILYEGYMLYPYRRSALKNQQRWNFGVLYPPAWTAMQTGSDSSHFQMECLICGGANLRLEAAARFLQVIAHSDGDDVWQEASEREVFASGIRVADQMTVPRIQAFSFGRGEWKEDGLVRRQELVQGEIQISTVHAGDDVFRLTVRLRNTSEVTPTDRDSALMRSLVSAHVVVTVREGEFVSQTDPPDALRQRAAACRNVGVWPVLVGEEGARDTVLGSPIILYDYPRVAPESAGDLFDGTEIDEILTLRILSLPDAEKEEARRSDERARHVLDRAEANAGEHVMQLHGAIREMRRMQDPEG